MDTAHGTNESAMVCIARTGDKEALRRLLQRNWRWLRGLVWNFLGEAEDVDDVLQNVCVQVIAQIGQLRDPERFRSWLAVIARNEATRSRRVKHRGSVRLDEQVVEPMHEATSVLDRLAEDEMAAMIRLAIGELPEKYREAFVLAYCDDLTYAQISEILDVPVTTVQMRLVRARRMIHDLVTTGRSERIPRT